jgi:hypothetical protein
MASPRVRAGANGLFANLCQHAGSMSWFRRTLLFNQIVSSFWRSPPRQIPTTPRGSGRPADDAQAAMYRGWCSGLPSDVHLPLC